MSFVPTTRGVHRPGIDIITPEEFPERSTAVIDRTEHTESLTDMLTYGPVGAIAGFADTVLQGVGVGEETVQQVLSNISTPMGEFYGRNKDGLRATGDILGLLPVAIGGSMLIRSGGMINRFAEKVMPGNKYVQGMFSTGRSAWDAAGGTIMQAKILATQGQKDFDISNSLVKGTAFIDSYRKDRATHVLDMVKENIAAEVAIFSVMRESDILFPEELSFVEQAAWMIPFHGAAAGISWWTFKSAVQRRLAQEVGPIAAKYGNEKDLPKSEVFWRADNGTGNVNRGVGIAIESVLRNAAADDLTRAVTPVELTNLRATITSYDTNISDQIVKLFDDNPVQGWTNREKVTPGEGAVNTAMHVSKQDPALFAGIRSLEMYNDDFAKNVWKNKEKVATQLEKQLGEAMENGAPDKVTNRIQAQIDALHNSHAVVLEVDGSITMLSRRRPIYQDGVSEIRFNNNNKMEPGIYNIKQDPKRGIEHKLGVAEDFSLRMVAPAGRTGSPSFEKLTPMEATSIWAAQKKAIDGFKLYDHNDNLLPPIHIKADAHFTQLDSILALHEKMGDAIFSRIKLDPQLKSIEHIQMAALGGKFKAFQKMQARSDFMTESSIEWAQKAALNKETMAKMLNLPGDDTAGMSPIMALFADMYRPGKTYQLNSFFRNMDEVKEGMARLHAPHDLGSPLKEGLATMGSLLKEFPEARKPVVAIIKGEPNALASRDRIVDAMAAQRGHILDELAEAGKNDAALVQLVRDEVMMRPDAFRAATDVTGLIEGTTWGKNKISNVNHQIRHSPTLVAADSLKDLTERRAIGWMKEKMEQARPSFLKLMDRKNQADALVFYNYVNARGHGWDVLENVVPAADSKGYHLVLDPTSEFNKKRWKELTGQNLDPDSEIFMPGPIGKSGEAPKPLYMTQNALDAASAFDNLSSEYLRNINYLRYLRGQKQIPRKQWYVPPKNISDMELIYLIDENNQLHQLVAGKTFAEARQLADDEVRVSGKKLSLVTQQDAARYHNLMGQEFFFPVNFSNPRAQTGRSTGKLTGSVVETGSEVLHSRIQAVQHMFDSVAKETMMVMFEPQLNFMRHQMRAAGVTPTMEAQGQTIWQQYTRRILGVPSAQKGDTPKQLYDAVEHVWDEQLEKLYRHLTNARTGIKPVQAHHARDFAALNDKVGAEFNPFDNIIDFAERTHQIKVPSTFKSQMGALNTITGALVLRIVDAGMAALNMLSLATTIPPVIRALDRMPEETIEAWKGRIGAWGSAVDDSHAFANPSRILASGAHWFLNNPEAKKLMQEAGKRNYLSQDIVERTKLWIVPHDDAFKTYLRKGVDALSIMTDKTETWSRGISFAYGLHIGKNMLKLADEEAMLFAHRLANQSVGDYRPNIRPQIFQGAAGSSLGLFTTWVWTYLQRVTADIADKRMGAVLNQVGMQSMIFGANSLPGLNQFIGTFTSNYDGSENIVDRLDKAYGDSTITDLVMRGSISNIPKIFGSDTGIDMYSRGDIQVPMLTGHNVGPSAPAIGLLTNIYQAMSQSVKALKEQGWSPRQQLEIMAAYSANRSFRGLVEVALDQAVDRQGSTIAQNIRTGIDATARVFGTRSIQEQKKRENLQAIRTIEIRQAELIDILSRDIRSTIRAGHGHISQDKLNKILHKYMRAGGKPENFKAYLAQQILVAKVDKSARVALKAITDNATAGRAAKILEIELGM